MQLDDPLVDALRAGLEVFMRHSTRNVIRFSKESGLSVSQIGALFRIDRKEACGVSDIGDDLGITSAAASQMLDRLVHQKLILRSEDQHDRRLKQIVLTAKGRQVLQASLQAGQSWLSDLANALTAAEKKQVMAAMHALIEKANQFEPQPDPER
jgi:DNA-binding MarR family transcriptional regulator